MIDTKYDDPDPKANPWRELWVEWFDLNEGPSGGPWSDSEWGGVRVCFFCNGDEPEHRPDCVYLKAKRLLDEEDK